MNRGILWEQEQNSVYLSVFAWLIFYYARNRAKDMDSAIRGKRSKHVVLSIVSLILPQFPKDHPETSLFHARR